MPAIIVLIGLAVLDKIGLDVRFFQKEHQLSDCQKNRLSGLEGRSPSSAIRIRRHVRRIRKPCCARLPYAVSRPGGP